MLCIPLELIISLSVMTYAQYGITMETNGQSTNNYYLWKWKSRAIYLSRDSNTVIATEAGWQHLTTHSYGSREHAENGNMHAPEQRQQHNHSYGSREHAENGNMHAPEQRQQHNHSYGSREHAKNGNTCMHGFVKE